MTKLSFLLAAALSLLGCKKSGGADCTKAIDHSMELAKADMQGMDAATLAKMRDLGIQHCKDDKWPDDAIQCMTDAKTEGDAQACYGKLTPDQQGKMNHAAMEAKPTPPAPATGSAPGSDTPPVQASPPDAAAGSSSGSASAGSSSRAGSGSGSASACTADPHHCCQPDGKIVEATCAPVVRKPSDSIARGADGSCKPCMLRCLPAAAKIRTPSGDVPVARLAVGDLVMTTDGAGHPVAAPVLRVRALAVTGPHEIVAITLADGRTLRASPGHPTATGALLGALAAGDTLDGSPILSIAHEAFAGDATWDLLPAGATGAYWADGVLVGSTLR